MLMAECPSTGSIPDDRGQRTAEARGQRSEIRGQKNNARREEKKIYPQITKINADFWREF